MSSGNIGSIAKLAVKFKEIPQDFAVLLSDLRSILWPLVLPFSGKNEEDVRHDFAARDSVGSGDDLACAVAKPVHPNGAVDFYGEPLVPDAQGAPVRHEARANDFGPAFPYAGVLEVLREFAALL